MSDTDSNKVTDVINAICELPTVKSASGSIATFTTDLTENLVDCVVDNSATKLVNISGNVTDLATYIRGIYQGNYGFVDLGSLNWTGTGDTYFNIAKSVIGAKTVNDINMLCSYYETTSGGGDKTIYDTANAIRVQDTTYATAIDFTNAMQGVYLIYELATPTTPTITQAQLTAICTAFGVSGVVTDLPTNVYPNTYNGTNNVFTDYNDVTVKYLETIGKAISE